jgi:hypothetical protein
MRSVIDWLAAFRFARGKGFDWALFAIVIQLLTAPAWGQSTFGSYVGSVKDPSGSVVSGCKITLKNTGTGTERTVTTDEAGSYVLVNIEPGNYEITMESPGFQKAEFPNLVLTSRQTVRIDGNLKLATQSDTVSVNLAAEAPINTEVSNIAETKLGRELIDLPVALGSRANGSTSAFTTLTTQAGVEVDNSGNISVAGGKIDMLSMSIDGISTMSPRNSAPVAELFPSFDGIAEIRVSEVNNTAEFGGISDVTTVSRSGANQFHGGVFENHQNSAFAARDTFSATVPKVIMNDFGGFLGGPISVPKLYNGKDKTFFFMTYEGLRLPGQQVLVESVPSLALRTGDLSVYSTVIKDLNGNPFPNNQIPSSVITPVSSAALKYLFPLPNTGAPNAISNNFVSNFPTPKSSNQGDIRLDQNINSKQSVFSRFTYKRRATQLAPCAGATGSCASALNGTALAGPNSIPENDWSLTGAYNFVITPHLVNEFRTGWTGSHLALTIGIPASTIAQQVGIAPYLSQNLAGVSTTPNIRISGFQRTGGLNSSLNQTQTFQVLDNLTWTHGQHTAKFGGDYRYLTALYTSVFASLWLGRYNFTNSAATRTIGNAYASFLLGVPDSSTLATVTSPDTRAYGSAYAFYAQDDWKVTPRLTINYGIRWEYHPMFQDHLGNVSAFLPDYRSIVNGVAVNGAVAVPNESLHLVNPAFAQSIAPTPILTADQAGIPNSLRYSQKTDFAPRVGFAWRVTEDGKTVIRGGYGKFIEAPLGYLILSSWAVEASDVATFTNSISNGSALYRFPYPFPSNLAQPGTQDYDLSYNLHYKDPYVQQWNLTIERDLGFQTGLRLSYDGSHGTDLDLTTNPDQVPANTIGFTKASASAPYPLWDSIVNVQNGGRSNYQALTVSVNKRMSKGLQFGLSYNFAKNLSNSGGYNPTAFAGAGGGQTSDYYNPNLDYGNVPFTRRHRFLATFLYETSSRTPNRLLNLALGGWEVAGVLLFQTGPFLSVTAPGTDPSGTNFDNSFNASGDPRADSVSGVNLYSSNKSIKQWVNPNAFAIPADNIGRFGSSAVGSVVGPGTQAIALSLYRSFKYKERASLRVGASATNLFNHPNYGVPNLQLGTNPFGTISSLQNAEGTGPRAIQLGGRLTF